MEKNFKHLCQEDTIWPEIKCWQSAKGPRGLYLGISQRDGENEIVPINYCPFCGYKTETVLVEYRSI